MIEIALIFGIVAGLIGSAGYSAIETVFLSLDRIRLHSQDAGNDKKFRKVLYFTNNPERFFIATQVGNNLVNVLYSSLFAVLFQRYGFEEEVVFLLSPLILLVFSEALPKAWARQFADRLAKGAAAILYANWFVLWPLNRAVEFSIHFFENLLGVEREAASNSLSRSDFTFALSDAAAAGSVSHIETRWIKRLINLSERTVADVITPRNRTAMIKIDASTDEAFRLLAQTGHKRLVCIGKNEDDLLGVIRASDLLKNPPDLQSILRPVPIVPESLPLIKLVEWLKKQRTHFALAIDEYGGFSGIVTLNDLASELVGQIKDQHSGDLTEFVKLNEKNYLVSGNIRLSHLMEITGFDPGETNANSLSGFLTELSDGIPAYGAEFNHSGTKLRVIKVDHQGVRLVRLALGVERNSGQKS